MAFRLVWKPCWTVYSRRPCFLEGGGTSKQVRPHGTALVLADVAAAFPSTTRNRIVRVLRGNMGDSLYHPSRVPREDERTSESNRGHTVRVRLLYR